MVLPPLTPPPFRAVVFDMDGTLLDTESAYREVLYEAAGTLGLEMTDALYFRCVGADHAVTARLLSEAFGPDFAVADFNADCRRRMDARLDKHVPLRPGAREIVDALSVRGLPLAVATSSRADHAIPHLKRAGLFDAFATIVTRDDVTHPKPHPEPYLTAAARLGVSPEQCLAIEDSPTGVRSAHQAGMQVILVPDLVAPGADIVAFCAAVFPSLHEVRAWLDL